jgi:hypothetical protein
VTLGVSRGFGGMQCLHLQPTPLDWLMIISKFSKTLPTYVSVSRVWHSSWIPQPLEMRSFKTSRKTNPTTHHHIPEDTDAQQRHGNLSSCILSSLHSNSPTSYRFCCLQAKILRKRNNTKRTGSSGDTSNLQLGRFWIES